MPTRQQNSALPQSRRDSQITTRTNMNKYDIANIIDGKTGLSSRVAADIRAGNIKINIFSDELFESWTGCNRNTTAVLMNGQIYLRGSSPTIHSDIIHEIQHLYDLQEFSAISSRASEIAAYTADREYQIAAGELPVFATEDEIRIHVYLEYNEVTYYAKEIVEGE